MQIEGYEKCPSCGKSLKDRVLVRLVDEKSDAIDFICFSEKDWDWMQKTTKKMGLSEEQTTNLFAELYLESIRLLKIGKKHKMRYSELAKMLKLFHG